MEPRTKVTDCLNGETLSAHVDGDLPQDCAKEVRAHLEFCVSCRNAAAELGSLRRDLAALGREVPPDLFPAIALRYDLAAGERTRVRSKAGFRFAFAVPAFAAAAAIVAVLALWRFVPRSATPAPHDHKPLSALESVSRAEEAYSGAIRELESSLEQNSAALDPSARAAIARSLGEIDESIERCRSQARAHPSSPEAHRAVLAAYQAKVDLLYTLVMDGL